MCRGDAITRLKSSEFPRLRYPRFKCRVNGVGGKRSIQAQCQDGVAPVWCCPFHANPADVAICSPHSQFRWAFTRHPPPPCCASPAPVAVLQWRWPFAANQSVAAFAAGPHTSHSVCSWRAARSWARAYHTTTHCITPQQRYMPTTVLAAAAAAWWWLARRMRDQQLLLSKAAKWTKGCNFSIASQSFA